MKEHNQDKKVKTKSMIKKTLLLMIASSFIVMCVNPSKHQVMKEKKYRFLKQYYSVDRLDKVIVGKKGTVLYFDSCRFINEDSTLYIGRVNVNLIECYLLSEIAVSYLTTETMEGDRLSTGGMIYVEIADSLGNQLKIEENSTLYIGFKKEFSVQDNMELFKGDFESDSSSVKWRRIKEAKKIKEGVYTQDGENAPVYVMSSDEYNIFGTSILGWINCDGFLKLGEQSTNLIVRDENNAIHKIIDVESRFLGVGYQYKNDENYYEFEKLQVGRSYIIYSVYEKDTSYYYSIVKYTAKSLEKNNSLKPEYNMGTFKQMKESLALAFDEK